MAPRLLGSTLRGCLLLKAYHSYNPTLRNALVRTYDEQQLLRQGDRLFAYRGRSEVVCVERNACLIAGSDEAMRQYIRDLTGMLPDKFTIRKTRLGEILDGVSAGAAYAFDEEAYSRFLPARAGAGLPAAEADFERARLKGRNFFSVRYVPVDP